MNDHVDSKSGAGNHNGAATARVARSGAAEPSVDFWSFAEILLLRWRWPVLAGVILAAMGLAFGLWHWKSSYTAPAQLISYNSPNATEIFGEREVSAQTLISVLRSPELLTETGAKASPPVSAARLVDQLSIMPDRNSDIIVVAITDPSRKRALELANIYAAAAVRFTQKMQGDAAAEMNQFFSRQLTNVDAEISKLNQQAGSLPASTAADLPVPTEPIIAQLQSARGELAGLLAKYTDAHPLVQAKRAEIAALEKELTPLAAGTTTNAAILASAVGESDPEVVRGKLEALEHTRLNLLDQRQAVQAFEANPPGFCKLLAPAMPKDVAAHSRDAKVFFLAVLAGMLGLLGGAAVILLVEIADGRLKTASDVRRVTKLPVLAASGDLNRLTEHERYEWAFRTWTKLQGRLSPSPNHGLVLGVTSAGNGEGRSTWVQLLAEAASLLGFRVLTIATRPSPREFEARKQIARNGGVHAGAISNANSENGSKPAENPVALAPNSNILATPAEVTEKLTGPNSQPVVHIPLPGWVWNLERRKQWQEALHHWSKIENVVILVELPPASVPEAVLLAENLPNIVWLTASGQAEAGETVERLETLRDARCRLAGSVLNRAPKSFLKKRLSRWVGCAVALAALNVSVLQAAEDENTGMHNAGQASPLPSERAGMSNSITVASASPSQAGETPALHDPRAGWQQHFTLGAGDVLDLSLYGEPTLTQLNVPIAPDGRVSFLEAQGVMAAGLTIDELRAKLDDELAKYRRAPRTIITPVAFNSKKYFLLGSVAHAGAFSLDQPTTIVEAIARAGGLATALQQRNVVEIADLQRAFLVRDGKRLPVDFETLFQRGDLSQNLALAPGDYLFIPPADLKQVYVVGEVQTPGPAAFNANLSAVGAIAEQGGFTEKAWKQKVLVIRGSLNHPQTFVVDAADVLAARAADFKLEPNDIIYVHYKPWAKVEDVLDIAATAFIQSAVITWTDIHAGPLITTPIIQ